MRIKFVQIENYKTFLKAEMMLPKNQNNIDLVIGQNASGKTTFAEAILRCLLKKGLIDERSCNIKLLASLDQGDKFKTNISIVLEDENNEYVIEKCYIFRKRNNKQVSLESSCATNFLRDNQGFFMKCDEILGEVDNRDIFFGTEDLFENLGSRKAIMNVLRNRLQSKETMMRLERCKQESQRILNELKEVNSLREKYKRYEFELDRICHYITEIEDDILEHHEEEKKIKALENSQILPLHYAEIQKRILVRKAELITKRQRMIDTKNKLTADILRIQDWLQKTAAIDIDKLMEEKEECERVAKLVRGDEDKKILEKVDAAFKNQQKLFGCSFLPKLSIEEFLDGKMELTEGKRIAYLLMISIACKLIREKELKLAKLPLIIDANFTTMFDRALATEIMKYLHKQDFQIVLLSNNDSLAESVEVNSLTYLRQDIEFCNTDFSKVR